MISKTELRNVLLKAWMNENYLIKNNDPRLGESIEFSFSELVELIKGFGQEFDQVEGVVDYCLDMEFDIESANGE